MKYRYHWMYHSRRGLQSGFSQWSENQECVLAFIETFNRIYGPGTHWLEESDEPLSADKKSVGRKRTGRGTIP